MPPEFKFRGIAPSSESPIPRLKNSRRLEVLTQREARVVRALAETMFPKEEGMPTVEEADVLGYFDSLLSNLQLKEKLLIRSLLALLEVQSLAFNGRRPRLFSQATPNERTRNLAGWEKSRIFQRRLTFMAIRTLLLWAYVDSSETERGMGLIGGTQATARRAAIKQEGTPPPSSVLKVGQAESSPTLSEQPA